MVGVSPRKDEFTRAADNIKLAEAALRKTTELLLSIRQKLQRAIARLARERVFASSQQRIVSRYCRAHAIAIQRQAAAEEKLTNAVQAQKILERSRTLIIEGRKG